MFGGTVAGSYGISLVQTELAFLTCATLTLISIQGPVAANALTQETHMENVGDLIIAVRNSFYFI